MHKAFLFLIFCLGLAAGSCGQSVGVLDDGIGLFRAGYREWSAEKMESALRVLARSTEDAGSLYWQLVAQFHLILCRNSEDPTPVIRVFEEVVSQNSKDAEFSMMLAVLYGRQIAARPIRAIWLGRKISVLRQAALRYGADNPRVQMLAGVSWMKAPRPFGDRGTAAVHLRKAGALFDAERLADCSFREPCWGAAECYTLLGDLLAAEEASGAARDFYQEALQVNPLYMPAQKGIRELNDENKK